MDYSFPRTTESHTAYTLLSEIASGGMGTVYLGVRRNGDFERIYAIKRLHPHLAKDPDVRTMFMDEARLAGLVRHPHVVSVVDLGVDAGGPFLAMEFVEGVSVSVLIKRATEQSRRIPVHVALQIAQQAASGLHAAHELRAHDGEPLGLVHRDVSPHNLLVGFDGITRVTDFGVAKAVGRQTHTQSGVIKGKFGYMAPEQLMYREVERRTDIFSLGIVLYELLSGRRLYPSGGKVDGARRCLLEPAPDIGEEREDVSDALVELLLSMLAKEPEFRPRTAHEVAERLGDMIHDEKSIHECVSVSSYVSELCAEDRTRLVQAIHQASRQASQQAEPSESPKDRSFHVWPFREAWEPRRVFSLALMIALGAAIGIIGYRMLYSTNATAGGRAERLDQKVLRGDSDNSRASSVQQEIEPSARTSETASTAPRSANEQDFEAKPVKRRRRKTTKPRRAMKRRRSSSSDQPSSPAKPAKQERGALPSWDWQ